MTPERNIFPNPHSRVGRAFQPGTSSTGLAGWKAGGYLIPVLLLLCSGAWANVLDDIARYVPDQPRSWAQMCATIDALRSSPRVSVVTAGQSAGGRIIPCVAVHDPATVFGETRRLMILGRQHGNEPSGTEACMALMQHLATATGTSEQDALRHVTFIFVPMVNPDGASANRRRNSRGVDLNRDWQALSQPETIAVERLVRAWRPDALIDMHDLPRSSPKPSYRENFIETIGDHSTVPTFVSTQTSATTQSLAHWLRGYGYRFNIYYDTPGRDRRLCHRHFGFDHKIPSYLFEAKTGAGRSLRYRAGFHAVGVLVVAGQLMAPAGSAPQAGTQVPSASGLEEIAPPQPTRSAPAGPTGLSLRYVEAQGADEAGSVEALVTGGNEIRYVKFYVDGHLTTVTSAEPYRCPIGPEEVGPGMHEVSASVVGADGVTLASARGRVDMDAMLAGGRYDSAVGPLGKNPLAVKRAFHYNIAITLWYQPLLGGI